MFFKILFSTFYGKKKNTLKVGFDNRIYSFNNRNHTQGFGILQNEHSFSKNDHKKCMD
jgi:hypothetical protein